MRMLDEEGGKEMTTGNTRERNRQGQKARYSVGKSSEGKVLCTKHKKEENEAKGQDRTIREGRTNGEEQRAGNGESSCTVEKGREVGKGGLACTYSCDVEQVLLRDLHLVGDRDQHNTRRRVLVSGRPRGEKVGCRKERDW